jgi:hypothetical protein
MKKNVFFTLFLIVQSHSVLANDLRGFLQNCAWGTISGATVGFVSLVFTDRPSDSWSNVAKGASLGLYAGIGYGLYQLNKEAKTEGQSDFAIVPQIQEGRIEGLQFISNLWTF